MVETIIYPHSPSGFYPPFQKKKSGGFTLIELSMVLVIIGLIVGGVLVGLDLIRAATIRAQVSQIEQYRTAVNVFRGKYNYLPGDLPATDAAQLGFVTRTGAQYHGDGDGKVIGGCGTVQLGCENALFWTDLSSANMIEQNFTYANADSLITAAAGTVGTYQAEGKIKGNYLEVRYYTKNSRVTLNSNTMLLIRVTNYNVGARIASDKIKPLDALNIDLKLDDGKPFTGTMVYTGNAAAPAAGVCVSNVDNTYNTSTDVYANAPSCSLTFKF